MSWGQCGLHVPPAAAHSVSRWHTEKKIQKTFFSLTRLSGALLSHSTDSLPHTSPPAEAERLSSNCHSPSPGTHPPGSPHNTCSGGRSSRKSRVLGTNTCSCRSRSHHCTPNWRHKLQRQWDFVVTSKTGIPLDICGPGLHLREPSYSHKRKVESQLFNQLASFYSKAGGQKK